MPKLSDFVAPGGTQTSGGTQGQVGSVFLTSLPSNDPISVGDLVVLGVDGKAYWATDPNSAPGFYPALRPISSPSDGSLFMVQGETLLPEFSGYAPPTTSNTGPDPILLSNGNIAILIPTGSPNGYQISVRNSLGAAQGPLISIVAPINNATFNMVPFPSGGFVIAYENSASNVVFSIYDNLGNNVAGPTTISTPINTGSKNISLNILSNGNFVITWMAVISGVAQAYCAIYSPSGSQILAPFSALTSATGTTLVPSACALSGGGFVVAAQSTAMDANFAIYSNSGAAGATGVIPTIDSGESILAFAIVAVSGGGFGSFCSQATSLSAGIFSAAGTQIGATLNVSIANNRNWVAVTPTLDGGFIGSFQNSTQFNAFYYPPSGVSPSTHATFTLTVPNSNIPGQLIALSDGTLVASVSGVIARFGLDGIQLGNTLTVATLFPNSGGVCGICAVPNTAGYSSSTAPVPIEIVAGNPSSGQVFYSVVSTQQAVSPVGVATAAASAGQNVTVQITGGVTTRLSFKYPLILDYRGNSPVPGQYMSIVGNTAILQGVQAPIALRPIN